MKVLWTMFKDIGMAIATPFLMVGALILLLLLSPFVWYGDAKGRTK